MLASSIIAANPTKNDSGHRPTSRSFADTLDKVRAKYAEMKSYSDTGTTSTEYGPSGSSVSERYTFTTFYRTPRQYLFDFKGGDDRVVIWADGTDFNTWWAQTNVHETYPKGQGANAFALTAFPTKNSALHIAPLLFSQAGLHGSIADFKLLRADSTETINGHRCFKLVGEVALAYGTGAVSNARPTTIWIDAESLLVRKLLEDTTPGSVGIDRVITTFEPEAEPKIDDAKFKFTPPASA